jgi:2-methylaconitate cis-trans-isomerase PrpF
MGSPDILQIDGLGGSRPITSKIAIIAPSSRSDADVDYTFAQVDIATGAVGYHGNCGNISAGVGPFAIDEGIVEAGEGHTTIRIWNTNTERLLIARVPTIGGVAATIGDYVVPGVPGSGAEIEMNWAATVGSLGGSLLPTGSASEVLTLTDGRGVEVSIVDAGNPCVWVAGTVVGLRGAETQDQLNGNSALLATTEEIRGRAAVALGLATDWREASKRSPGLPMLGYVYPPTSYRTINGASIEATTMDVRLHLMFMGLLHESVAGSGSVCLAAASATPGTVVERLVGHLEGERLRIGHPSGVTPCRVKARRLKEGAGTAFDDLGFSRTARRLMDGLAYVPMGD